MGYGGAVSEMGRLGRHLSLIVSQLPSLARNMLRGSYCHGEERGHKVTRQDVILHGLRVKIRMLPWLQLFFHVGPKHKTDQYDKRTQPANQMTGQTKQNLSSTWI
jgi:hypothetical protein